MKNNNLLLPLLLVCVVLFGLMALAQSVDKPAENTAYDRQIESLQTVSTSDEVTDIEGDLSATDLNTLDSEMYEIEGLLK